MKEKQTEFKELSELLTKKLFLSSSRKEIETIKEKIKYYREEFFYLTHEFIKFHNELIANFLLQFNLSPEHEDMLRRFYMAIGLKAIANYKKRNITPTIKWVEDITKNFSFIPYFLDDAHFLRYCQSMIEAYNMWFEEYKRGI